MASETVVRPTPEAAKIQSLEGLRGLMAWWVALGHISLTFGWDLPIIDRNRLAVDVFILLSGFVIARLIDRKQEPYGPYILRRGFRLFPLYLVVLVVSSALLQVQLGAWEAFPVQTDQNIKRIALAQEGIDNFVAHFLVHLPLAQGLVPSSVLQSSATTLVGQAWSISLEWQFYLLAPFFMWCTRSWKGLVIGLGVVVLLTLATLFVRGGFLGDKIFLFGLGICTYLYFDRPEERRKWLAGAALFAVLTVARYGVWQFVPLAIWIVTIAAAILHNRRPIGYIQSLLSAKPLVHLGQISYSVYLLHMIPLYTSIYLLERQGMNFGQMEVAVPLITIVGTYLLAIIAYRWIEQPGIDLGARIGRASTPSAAAG